MLETVSIGSFSGYAALVAYERSNTAVSRQAAEIRSVASGVVKNSERSVALFGPKARALDQLEQVAAECSESGWDGSDAQPVSELAKINTAHFIRMMPVGLPLPEFSVEPDGAISLDWMSSKNRVFSVSVAENDRLAFAWLDGTDRGHGVAQVRGGEIPLRVLEGIRAVFSTDALLRAA